jgi:tRNA (guanine9-N1)-methyltransferase
MNSEHSAAPLSKNAQKRLVKAARRAEQKSERRAREKAHRRERKRLRHLEDGDVLQRDRPPVSVVPFDARVIIDLGFDELMTPKVFQCDYTHTRD